MNYLIKIDDLEKYNIEKITDGSEPLIDRMSIKFKSGYCLSVIRGKAPHFVSYGSDKGLYEIAPKNKKGELDGKILNFDGDDVEGYLTKEEVFKYIEKMAKLK